MNTKAILVIAAAVLAATVGAGAQPYAVNVAGASLQEKFIKAPASTNDFINVDGDAYYGQAGVDLSHILDYQLAENPYTTTGSWWTVTYRLSASGQGFQEMRDYALGQLNSATVLPTMSSATTTYINRQAYDTQHGVVIPVSPTSIDIAVMDVPTAWITQNASAAGAAWNATPGASGYGHNPDPSPEGQYHTLLELNNTDRAGDGYLNTDVENPDSRTVFDTQHAWAPIGFGVNMGVGLPDADGDGQEGDIKMSELQHGFVTGRLSNGENLVFATRIYESGTRNGAMNSIGVDPSWGVGDNVGVATTSSNQAKLGPDQQANQFHSSSHMEECLADRRLAIGYDGMEKCVSFRNSGDWEIANVWKDIDSGTAADSYVRPEASNVFDNADANTGWQVGGPASMATVGDPYSGINGNTNPAMANPEAAKYIRNIVESVKAYAGDPGVGGDANYMPGEWLAQNFTITAACQAQPSLTNPTQFVDQTGTGGYNAQANQDAKTSSVIHTGAYGGASVAGKVPEVRNGRTTYEYWDGSSFQTVAADGTQLLNERNKVMGDFNYAGGEKNKRNTNDIAEMMKAFYSPRDWQKTAAAGGAGATGSLTVDNAIPEILGDYDGDGEFTAADIRYFADGLAIDPASGKLNRKLGFTIVDNAWLAAGGASVNFFGTALKTGKTYAAGDSRGDIAGAIIHKGAEPTGADGNVDARDINYLYSCFTGKNLDAVSGVQWANIDEAALSDLSADINGDMSIDSSDVTELVEGILGTRAGDINLDGTVSGADLAALATNWNGNFGTPSWELGDLNGDGMVSGADLAALATNWNYGASPATGSAVPEPATLALLGLGGLALIRRRRSR